MSKPFGTKSDSNRVAGIIEQLQIEKEKSADVQSIIEADLQHQQALMDKFQKSQNAAEEKFREKMMGAQLETEKKLERFLTPGQMEIYRQLMSRDEPRPDDFEFNIPEEPMEPKDLKQQAPSMLPEGNPDLNQKGIVPITWTGTAQPDRI
jgi:hypothetical protein